jgi:CRP-like cAMP-binding protein
MSSDINKLWFEANRCLQAQNPAEAICYLAEIVSASPAERHARTTLALALGDAGHPSGALRILTLQAERLVHEGYLLPAIVIILHGLRRSGDEPHLLQALRSLHVRGVRAKAGNLAVPPPLAAAPRAAAAANAAALLAMDLRERLTRAAEVGAELPPAGPAVLPAPMPLFCELETESFVETVKRLQYHHAATGTPILKEGTAGDSLIILVSGQVSVSKAGTVLAQLGQGSVIGEMALITQAPRSATVTALEPIEYFELGRTEVGQLAKSEPKVMQELVAYCRGRLLLNLLQTSPLFVQFDEATRNRLLGHFRTVTFPGGHEIIAQGTAGTGLYVIASGRVQVQVTGDDGNPLIVGTLGPGEVFGEISLLSNQPTTADVIAQETVGALVLPAAVFQEVLAGFPQARHYLESLSADRLKASREAIAAEPIDPDDIVVL